MINAHYIHVRFMLKWAEIFLLFQKKKIRFHIYITFVPENSKDVELSYT